MQHRRAIGTGRTPTISSTSVGRYAATGQPIDVIGLASATLSILFHPEQTADLDRISSASRCSSRC